MFLQFYSCEVILLEWYSSRRGAIIHCTVPTRHNQLEANLYCIRRIKERFINAPWHWSPTEYSLIFPYIQCLQLIYSEVAWELVSSGAQVQLQIILDPDYLPDYLLSLMTMEKLMLLSELIKKTLLLFTDEACKLKESAIIDETETEIETEVLLLWYPQY